MKTVLQKYFTKFHELTINCHWNYMQVFTSRIWYFWYSQKCLWTTGL